MLLNRWPALHTEDHPSRLASQHALTGAYRANGQVGEAVALLQHVVEIEGKTLAVDHPSRLAEEDWLAHMLRDLRREPASPEGPGQSN